MMDGHKTAGEDAGLGAADVTGRLWEAIAAHEGRHFQTAKGLDFTYHIKGYEMFVSRKDKSLTKATVELAYRKAMELQRTVGFVKGPKKLGCFGASYLYPIFLELGLITAEAAKDKEQEEEL